MISEEKRIKTKAQLKEWLAEEIDRYPNHGRYRIYNILLMSENAILRRHQILLRKTEYHINSGHRVLARIYRLRLELMQIKYGMHIPPNTFEKGLHVMHVGEMHINGNASGGKNCAIHVHTSLAAGGFSDDVPTIGDGVVLFMGAIVCGNTYIANNVVIGANSVVGKSVFEENVTVAGNPAQIVGHRGRLDMGKNKELDGGKQ